MPNPVVHFEISGRDGVALRQFYSDAFDWRFDADDPTGFGLLDPTGEGIGGVIGGGPASVTLYIEVPDLSAAIERVRRSGGTILQPITEEADMVPMALFADLDGNVLGLLQAEPRDSQPVPSAEANGGPSLDARPWNLPGGPSEPVVPPKEHIEPAGDQ